MRSIKKVCRGVNLSLVFASCFHSQKHMGSSVWLYFVQGSGTEQKLCNES